MKIVKDKITIEELKTMAKNMFGNTVKAVVDIELKLMAVDAELHSDEEALLLQNGSKQENLWGINIFPNFEGPERIEFDSMINLRPAQGNHSRGVDNPETRQTITKILNEMIEP